MLVSAMNSQIQKAIYLIVLRWIDDYLQESSSGSQTGTTLMRRPALVAEGNDKGNFESLIKSISARYNVDPRLVSAVVQAESNFDPNAESPAGAQGLMQLMPATAKDLGVKNSLDPAQNIEGGVKYLRNMLDLYDGNVSTALAAYNAGPGTVSRYGGIPPYTETQTYVNRVLSIYQA
ncbi:MAG: lytic transglycosylase domain-containing protein [Leptolinea sp.]